MHVSKWPIFSPLIRNKNFENGGRGGGGEIPKEGSRDLAPEGGQISGGGEIPATSGRTRVSSVYTAKTNPGQTRVSSVYPTN